MSEIKDEGKVTASAYGALTRRGKGLSTDTRTYGHPQIPHASLEHAAP